MLHKQNAVDEMHEIISISNNYEKNMHLNILLKKDNIIDALENYS